jgi:protocatechuate 3,4-dioxygenase beta subunit
MHDHDLGLRHDLPRLISRRRALAVMAGGVGAAFLAGCGSSDPDPVPPAATADTASGTIPEETAGPFPGDGSNGPDVLAQSGVVREDITKSFGDASGVADGVPTTLAMTLTRDGTPLPGAAVYVWHCDREGRYSLYDDTIAGENYLRGVQESGDDGTVRFTTVFPAAYPGRWPHVHFEVYESLDAATTGRAPMHTSQLAIPQDACDAAYASAGYEQSAQTLAQLSLDSDMVFADGYEQQLATAEGDPDGGYALTLAVGV